MNMPEFALQGTHDFWAVCLKCRHKHLISKGERIDPQPWLDWLTKHAAKFGCRTLVALDKPDLLDSLHHNADLKVAYVASADYTITLTGLASDTNLLAGREGSALSNASNKYLDVLMSGKITTGSSPTDNRVIEVHAIFSLDDTPNYPDVFDGTDSAETITSIGIKSGISALTAYIATNNTSDRTYPFKGIGLRQFIGDAVMPAHVPFVTHSTAVNFNATASNHKVTNTPVYATAV